MLPFQFSEALGVYKVDLIQFWEDIIVIFYYIEAWKLDSYLKVKIATTKMSLQYIQRECSPSLNIWWFTGSLGIKSQWSKAATEIWELVMQLPSYAGSKVYHQLFLAKLDLTVIIHARSFLSQMLLFEHLVFCIMSQHFLWYTIIQRNLH